MRHVINLIFVSLFLTFSLYGQKAPEKLKQEQRKLEKKITQTKALLKSVQANSKASLQEVALLNSQIKDRENLVRVFDSQVRGAEFIPRSFASQLIPSEDFTITKTSSSINPSTSKNDGKGSWVNRN